MPPILRRFFATRRATAAIEFSIVVPVMLTFMAGVVELGHAFQTYRAVNQLASRYAITYADCSDTGGACNTILATYGSTTALQNLVPQLDSSKIVLRMFQVQMSGTTPVITYAWPTGATLTGGEQTAVANALPAAQPNMVQIAVVVTVTYPFQFAFFQSLANKFWSSPPASYAFTVAQTKS